MQEDFAMDVIATLTPMIVLFVGGWSLFSSGYSFDLRAKSRQMRMPNGRRNTDRTRPMPSLR
ncbi:MAG: hypothetical protein B7733_25550 [Myxococcales bacterium FL481]|nr:MAG: hypothetical protein B7733_25550 [Myxococcales bacterium FL481]